MMGKTATLNLRLNPDVKENAENVVLTNITPSVLVKSACRTG